MKSEMELVCLNQALRHESLSSETLASREQTRRVNRPTWLVSQVICPGRGTSSIYIVTMRVKIDDRLMEQQLEEQGFYSYNYRQLISKASFFESHSLSGQPPECTGCCDWICQMTNNIHRMRNQRKVFFFLSNSAPTPVNADIYAHSSRIPTEYAGTALSLLWQISRRSIPRDDLKKEKK